MAKLMRPAVEIVKVASLKTDETFAKTLPAQDNLDSIRADIQRHGVLVPLLTSADDLVLDGHTRLRLAKELGLETVPVIRTPVDAKKTWLRTLQIALNLHRRHLNELQRVALGTSLEKIEREKAKLRHKEGSRRGGEHKKEGQANGAPGLAPKPKKEAERATERAARQVGLSRRTYERGKAVLERAPDEVRTSALLGELSISAAHRQLKEREQAEAVTFKTPLVRESKTFTAFESIPRGRYHCVYVQTPLDRGSEKILEQLLVLDVPSLADSGGCHLWLWASWRMLRDGVVERLFEKWKFHWVAEVVWHKGRPEGGDWIRPSTEVCVLARQGPLDVLLNQQIGFLDVKCRDRGERPEEMRAFVERCTQGPRIEIFARGVTPGWDAFAPKAAEACRPSQATHEVAIAPNAAGEKHEDARW